jgi:hypothetical protein
MFPTKITRSNFFLLSFDFRNGGSVGDFPENKLAQQEIIQTTANS